MARNFLFLTEIKSMKGKACSKYLPCILVKNKNAAKGIRVAAKRTDKLSKFTLYSLYKITAVSVKKII